MSDDGDGDRAVDDPFERLDAPGDGEGDLFADTGERGDPFEEAGVFERMDVDAADPDAVWERLGDARERGREPTGAGTTAEVSKHAFCERCEHFSAPPDVACTHEGTEILGFPDMETVRVADCPVVAEREELDGA